MVFYLLYGPALETDVTTGKTTALTIQTFVGREMSLLFKTLSRFVITFYEAVVLQEAVVL